MALFVLAAEAIEPADGFNWAFKNGADFICVNTTINVLDKLQGHTREWYG